MAQAGLDDAVMQVGQLLQVTGVAVFAVALHQAFQPGFRIAPAQGFLFDKQPAQIVGFGFADVVRHLFQYVQCGLRQLVGTGGVGVEAQFAFDTVEVRQRADAEL